MNLYLNNVCHRSQSALPSPFYSTSPQVGRSQPSHSWVSRAIGARYIHLNADFENVNRENDKVYEDLKTEWDQYNKIVSDLKMKKNKDTKFIEGGAGYLLLY